MRVGPQALAKTIQRTVVRFLGRLFLALHPRQAVRGIKVVFSDPVVDQKMCVDTIKAALDLMSDVDPRGFSMVTRYVNHVLVWPGSYTAYDKWGGIHLAARHAIGVPAPLLASALLHEATHLRISRRGIPYLPALRSRIEAACVKTQASFLRRIIPEGPAWADRVEAGLREPWWSEADRRARVQQSLRDAGLPPWLEPLLFRPNR